MTDKNETRNMALFCDFENVALAVLFIYCTTSQ